LMDVSIVIPAHNAQATLADCLAAATGQLMPAGRSHEVIVVDDGSVDGTSAICGRFPVTLIRKARAGVGAARNAGVFRARGTWVAFTDADCIPSRRWAWSLVAAAQSAGGGALGAAGKTVGHESLTPAARFVDLTGGLDAQRHLAHPTFPFAPNCNLLYRRAALLEVGGYDERFTNYETQDLHHRLCRQHRGAMTYEPRALVLHRHRATWSEYYRQQCGYGRGHGLLYLRYSDQLHWNLTRELAAWARIAALAPGALLGRGDALLVRCGTLVKQLGYRVGFVRTYYNRHERRRLAASAPVMPSAVEAEFE
jgi:glycosyltransferase involved in cell wall biosynthesis